MTTTVPAILKYLSDSSNYNIDQNMESPVRTKKRRLDHLSWEEKLQRKKLKNRVAAQTSRDRKKAKMDQMEKAIQDLFSKNETLLTECESLKKLNQRLAAENSELRLRTQCCHMCAASPYQSRPVECEADDGGPAASPKLLRPQGASLTHSAAALVSRMRCTNWQHSSTTKNSKEKVEALVKIALACLLYRTSSSSTWTSPRWSSSRKVCCRISPGTWKLLLRRQICRNSETVKKTVQEKWWGRHQNNWNPVEVKC